LNLFRIDLSIPVEQDGKDEYLKAASQQLNVCETALHIEKILSKSLDIGNREQFFYNISLVVHASDSFDNKDNLPVYTEKILKEQGSTTSTERPVVIGFGPAGS